MTDWLIVTQVTSGNKRVRPRGQLEYGITHKSTNEKMH